LSSYKTKKKTKKIDEKEKRRKKNKKNTCIVERKIKTSSLNLGIVLQKKNKDFHNSKNSTTNKKMFFSAACK
jgi:hypothetical protein